MNPILQVNQLTGGYHISNPVLHDVSFSVQPGEIIGLIGLNGAGKSTTMKHILGIMKPIHGNIVIQGKTIKEDVEAYRSSFSYVPESPLLYDELTVREHMHMTAMAYGLSKLHYEQRTDFLIREFNMTKKIDSFTTHLSKGMRQKVLLMCAFLVEPPLYIIDEPFIGLDPLGIRSLLEKMVQIKKSGASILLSSHILSTIEKYCDRFIVLHNGKIIHQGTLQELRIQKEQPSASLEEVFYEMVKEDASSWI